jgi:hypothetical protein
MKRADFIRAYTNRSGLSDKWAEIGLVDREEGRHGWVFIALPCACGKDGCQGWAMLSAEQVLDHLQFNAPEILRDAYMKSVGEEEAKTKENQ